MTNDASTWKCVVIIVASLVDVLSSLTVSTFEVRKFLCPTINPSLRDSSSFLMWGCITYVSLVSVSPAADDRQLFPCVEKHTKIRLSCLTARSFGTTFPQPYYICIPTHKPVAHCFMLQIISYHIFSDIKRAFFQVTKMHLAVGSFKRRNNLLLCRSYTLLLHTVGMLTVIYCR